MLAAKRKLVIRWQLVSVIFFFCPTMEKLKLESHSRVLSTLDLFAVPSDFSLQITQASGFSHNGHVTY